MIMPNLQCSQGFMPFIVALVLIECCYGFYVQGLSPVNYCGKDFASNACQSDIPVFVNRLNSVKTAIPFEYDHFDFCSSSETKSPSWNLGQVVFGDRIRQLRYNFTFGESRYGRVCKNTYRNDTVSKKKIETLIQAIKLGYEHHWIIDNMPVTSCYVTEAQGAQSKSVCYPSFPVGCYVGKNLRGKDDCHSLLPRDRLKPDRAYLFNHMELTIEYHRNDDDDGNGTSGNYGSRLVKAQVTRLASIVHKGFPDTIHSIMNNEPLVLSMDLPAYFDINYSYQVTFKENVRIQWSSRWDNFLESSQNESIAWFSTLNSMIMVLFLSGVMAMVFSRTIYRNTSWFKKPGIAKRIFCLRGKSDPRWLLVQGDVFRPPCGALLLSVALGSGVQILGTTIITLVYASLGFLSPASHGSLMNCVLLLVGFLGTPAGCVSSMVYKMCGGEKWLRSAVLTACLCPGIVFTITVILNIAFWSAGSSAAIPCYALLGLLGLWFGLSVPLTVVGAYAVFKLRAIEHPVQTNEIAREIPRRPLFASLTSAILAGILPFGCVFTQLYFVLNSIWFDKLYNMFGSMFVTFVILVIICSETAIPLCYFLLCSGDYHWWWRSFLTSGFTAFYFFLYCIFYYVARLEMEGFLNALIYFGCTCIMTFILFLLTGTIGFFACFWFVRKIYGTVGVDNVDNDELSEKLLVKDIKEAPTSLAM